jgi:phenylacetate-coenzyme A ligase PaaK-like adenylate-forming protein
MIKVKGVNIWPQTIDAAVFAVEEIEEYNGRVWIHDDGHETVSLKAEFKPGAGDEPSRRAILDRLRATLRETTQVTMDVDEVPHGTLPRFECKARRWTDERIKGLERVSYLEHSAPTAKR